MSYCVNCGVKLAQTESKCPLCSTPVRNPNEPDFKPAYRAYSDQVEQFAMQRINRRNLGWLLASFVLLSVAILVVCDLLTLGQITWSLYAVIAGVYLICCGAFLYMRCAYGALCIWTAGNLFLLGAIAWLTDGLQWFYYLAAPMAIAAGAYLIFCVWSLKKRKNLLRNTGWCLLICGIVLIGIECLTDLHLQDSISLFWSIYAMLPIAVLSVFLICLSFNKKLLDEIRRRVFI